METTHRTNTASGTSKLTVPFYAPPPCVKKTSAEIISEARASIVHDKEGIRMENTRMAASIRPVNTKRPFTPRERQRTLFGTAQKSSCRPPSSFRLEIINYIFRYTFIKGFTHMRYSSSGLCKDIHLCIFIHNE
jgi:hypothetical protein